MPQEEHPPRILLAKIGLDGHDRGVKVLARSFRDAGIEVIYTGLWQTCEATMYAALQEDVDIVGVSLLSAAHMTVMPELVRLRKELGLEHIALVLGGIVPAADYARLKGMGVAEVFNPGSPLDKIIATLRELSARRKSWSSRQLIDGYQRRDARLLAQLITAIVRGQNMDGWSPPDGTGKVIGVTGAPGVGKSSFIAKLGRRLRRQGHTVAVVAVDPSSPLTGGALLGDRLRMMTGEPDGEFFIRSLSSSGAAGGLAPRCSEVVAVLRGFGFDYVLVETVGAGQSDVSIRELTDHTLLLVMPDSGDAIQFLKAGIMEIAAGVVLNKCDLHGADATEAQLRSTLGRDRPFWKVSAVRDEGFDAVAAWIAGL
jgi:LAO/AO transport system ATPase